MGRSSEVLGQHHLQQVGWQPAGHFSAYRYDQKLQLLDTAAKDVRRLTGLNYRTIILLAEKNRVEELENYEIVVEHHEIPDSEKWRVDFIKEVIELKLVELVVKGFTAKEIQKYLYTE